MPNLKIEEFLRENNAIEGVHNDISLEQAKVAWKYLIGEKIMTVGVILKTHKLLMYYQILAPHTKGCFRKCPVFVGGKEQLDWRKIPARIQEWCASMESVNPPHDEMDLHISYEKIHPFVDGNGRTGRMFLNWLRLRRGKPLLIIHEGKEQREYYKLFQ